MRPRDNDWAQAKRLCRLSAEDVRMAKALGLNPRKLIKNIPGPKQRWKAPVRDWVRELYRKRHGGPAGEPTAVASRDAAGPQVEELEEDAIDGGDWPLNEPSWDEEVLEEETEEQDRQLLRRQKDFRTAADYASAAFARLPFVERVVLFGSVAQRLGREVPRFRRFRRARVALWHECRDVDLAVWVSDTSQLESLRKTLGRAVNALFAETEIGVAHHQVDVFVMEPGTDRYLGRLCHFATCPKGKPECRVPRCGASPFLRQHDDFVFDPQALDPARSVVLFERPGDSGVAASDRSRGDIPF